MYEMIIINHCPIVTYMKSIHVSHEFKEKRADENPLPDKNAADIITLMSLLHPPSIELNGEYLYYNTLFYILHFLQKHLNVELYTSLCPST